MAPDVDAVPVVPDGARNATDVMAGLNDDGVHIGTAKKLQGGCEPRGAGAYEEGSLRHEHSRCLRLKTTDPCARTLTREHFFERPRAFHTTVTGETLDDIRIS